MLVRNASHPMNAVVVVGGMRKRGTAIAKALVNNDKGFVHDEVFRATDEANHARSHVGGHANPNDIIESICKHFSKAPNVFHEAYMHHPNLETDLRQLLSHSYIKTWVLPIRRPTDSIISHIRVQDPELLTRIKKSEATAHDYKLIEALYSAEKKMNDLLKDLVLVLLPKLDIIGVDTTVMRQNEFMPFIDQYKLPDELPRLSEEGFILYHNDPLKENVVGKPASDIIKDGTATEKDRLKYKKEAIASGEINYATQKQNDEREEDIANFLASTSNVYGLNRQRDSATNSYLDLRQTFLSLSRKKTNESESPCESSDEGGLDFNFGKHKFPKTSESSPDTQSDASDDSFNQNKDLKDANLFVVDDTQAPKDPNSEPKKVEFVSSVAYPSEQSLLGKGLLGLSYPERVAETASDSDSEEGSIPSFNIDDSLFNLNDLSSEVSQKMSSEESSNHSDSDSDTGAEQTSSPTFKPNKPSSTSAAEFGDKLNDALNNMMSDEYAKKRAEQSTLKLVQLIVTQQGRAKVLYQA